MKTKIKLIGILALLLMTSNQAYSQPDNDSLRKWAQSAASEVMTFHFGNFEEQRTHNKHLFTDSGYEKFYSALERSNIPKAVSDNKYMVETQALCLPKITQEPSAEDQFYVLEFPSKTTWIQGARAKKDFMRVTMKVADISNETGNYGIEQWIAIPIEESEASACSPSDYKRARIETLRKEIMQKEQEIKQLESEIVE